LPRTSPQVPAATVQLAPRPTEDKATRQLAETVSGLAADRDRLVARIATIERNLAMMLAVLPASMGSAAAHPQVARRSSL